MHEHTREEHEARLLKVQLYIQRHLDQELPLEELAKVACLSPYHFHRIFHNGVGEPVQEYIRRLRLEMAAAMLFYTELDINAIAGRNGYCNKLAFSRTFKEHFGLPPREYRKQRKTGAIHSPPDYFDQFRFKLRRQCNALVSLKIETFPERTVACVRHVGPYSECVAAWIKLRGMTELLPYVKTGQMIGIGYDDPDVTPPDKIRYDACLEVEPVGPPLDGVVYRKLAGGKYAVTLYRGSYDGLYDVNCFFYGQWLPDSGYELRLEPQFYIHYNTLKEVAPEELLTALCVPLQ